MVRNEEEILERLISPWNSGLEQEVWNVLKGERFGLTAREISRKLDCDASPQKVGKICYKHPLIASVPGGTEYGRRWRSMTEREVEIFTEKLKSMAKD